LDISKLFSPFSSENTWKMSFHIYVLIHFFNTIFTRIFSLPFPPICIPFIFNWILIQSLNWIQIPFNVFEFNLGVWIQFKLRCRVVHASISYKNELLKLILKTFEFFSCSTRIFFFSLFFGVFLVLVQITKIYCMLHIVSYHHYILAKINLYQNYSNMSYEHVLLN